ncbi:putative trehalose utilisation [Lyophyllum shimeji]|uniref:Trehalose utilisation n=1 Tax=Lyophyllum shimeji TaxID=47721 RepID=A0A9P3PR67_LYOSH|nr:putative trehalose utilisation [Lyophyllum shimeji]
MLLSVSTLLFVFLSLFLINATLAQRQSIPARVLIYSATARFRHDSIPTAIAALKAKGAAINVEFDATEDRAQFTDTVLAGYDAVLFLSTTGEVLDDAGKAAFQKYLNLGGNFIGIHSCSDSLVNTTFYGREVGAYFDYHPALRDAIVDVVDSSHPSTRMLPAEWHIRDEMYNFKSDPRSVGATVVLAANESSYVDDGTRKFDQGSPHPLAWYQSHGSGVDDEHKSSAGRSFYTSLGHSNETWQDNLFLAHVLGGVSWTLQSNTTRAMNSSALVGNPQGQSSGADASGSPTNSGTAPANTTQSSGRALPTMTSTAITIIAVVVGYVQFFLTT